MEENFRGGGDSAKILSALPKIRETDFFVSGAFMGGLRIDQVQ